MRNNKYTRQAAIQAILNTYYTEDGSRTDVDFDFIKLFIQVSILMEKGSSDRWCHAVNQWLNCIQLSWKIFCDENEVEQHGYDNDYLPRNHFTETTGREYDNRFHWALHQGIFYVWGI